MAHLLAAALILISPGIGCYEALGAQVESAGGFYGPIKIIPGLGFSEISAGSAKIPEGRIPEIVGDGGAVLQNAAADIPVELAPAPEAAAAPLAEQTLRAGASEIASAQNEPDLRAALERLWSGSGPAAPSDAAILAPFYATPGSGLGKLAISGLTVIAADQARPIADRFSAVKLIANHSDDFAKLALEEIGTGTPAMDAQDYEVKRQALRALAEKGKLVSLPPISLSHKEEILRELSRNKPTSAIFDWDGTWQEWFDKASPETGAALKAMADAGVRPTILTGKPMVARKPKQIPIEESMSTLTVEQKAAINVASDFGAKALLFDPQGEARLILEKEPWTESEHAALKSAGLAIQQVFGSEFRDGERSRFEEYHYKLYLNKAISPEKLAAAAVYLQKLIDKMKINAGVLAQPARGDDPVYLFVHKYDKSAGVLTARAKEGFFESMRSLLSWGLPPQLTRLAARLLSRLPSFAVPSEETLLVGDSFFGAQSFDIEMTKGAPGAMALAVGGSADPRIDNVFVWPTSGHEATVEIAQALAKPVPAAEVPEDQPIAPEAARTIRGFSLARSFSIAAFALFNIAMSATGIDALGKDAFATVGIVSSLVGIPLSFVNGILVDKLSARQILVGGSTMLALVGLAAYVLVKYSLINLGTLVPLSIISQFMLIAILVGEGSLIPKILGGNQKGIQKTNALFDLIFSGISMAASLVGGFLVHHWLGHAGTFLLYCLVQALVVLPIYRAFMPKTTQAPASSTDVPKPKPGLLETFGIIKGSPYLKSLLGLTLIGVFLAFPLRITLLPVIAKTYLHGSDATIGLINTAVFAGMTVASLFNTFFSTRFTNATLLRASALAFPAFGVMLAWPTSMAALFAAVATIFMFQTIGSNVLRTLYMKEAQNTHPEHMGRLMGISSAMFGLAISTGTTLVKIALGAAVYPTLLWYFAIPYAVATVLFLLAPRLLKVARQKTHYEPGPRGNQEAQKQGGMT